MFNSKFILEDGTELYPGYLEKEQRQQLKDKFVTAREYMRCGCCPDKNLFYRISEDLRIYPEHNGYQHDKFCSRYRDKDGSNERQTAYLINEEDLTVTAYCSFNPRVFSTYDDDGAANQDNVVPEEQSDENNIDEIIVGQEDVETKKEKKPPKLTLPALIRSINVDSYTEKILNHKRVDSKDLFSKFVYLRMKKVRIDRSRRPIGDMTLEQDGVRFIYLPFVDAINQTKKGITRCYVKTQGPDGKEYSNFIFPETLQKELDKFKKSYGIDPNSNTMIAGFQYLKRSRKSPVYRVLGRIHIFQVSNVGVYCRSLTEVDTFNSLYNIANEDRKIKFWIPPEDEDVGAIIQIERYKKKILLLFKSRKKKHIEVDTNLYEPFVVEEGVPLTKEILYSLLDGRTSESSWFHHASTAENQELELDADQLDEGIEGLPPLPEDDYMELPPLPDDINF